VSWFQEVPVPSQDLLKLVGATRSSAVIDVGGGASRLVDHLVSLDYDDITVLDLSQGALAAAQVRLGEKADRVTWINADVTVWEPDRCFDVWHDRAAFHFLLDTNDQTAYYNRLRRALRPGGHAIIGTFASDGPEKCSGLAVKRHGVQSLSTVFGQTFLLVDHRNHEHVTPVSSTQKFQFSTFQFYPNRSAA
jgi:ubiquinone/menaquinone biosynthesis C-methylase UbiE